MALRTHYDNLKVSRTATKAEIKKAYRQLCNKHHPDKHPEENRKRQNEILTIINASYKILSNDVERRKHDEWIAHRELCERNARAAEEERAAEAKAKAEREAKAKAEQETKAEAERKAKEKAAREEKARAEREAKAKAEQEAKMKAEREAQAEREAKAEREARAKANREARERAEKEARDKAKREAEEKSRREAEEKVNKRKREEEERIKNEIEKARIIAEEKVHLLRKQEMVRKENITKGLIFSFIMLLVIGYMLAPKTDSVLSPSQHNKPSSSQSFKKNNYNTDNISIMSIKYYTQKKENGILTIDIYYAGHSKSFNPAQARKNISGILKGTKTCNDDTIKEIDYAFHFLSGGNRQYAKVSRTYACN